MSNSNNQYTFITRYEGPRPCNEPDWKWSCFVYSKDNNILIAATSGPTRQKAIDRAKRLLKQ